jgi:inositol-phosphate transport system permease protein
LILGVYWIVISTFSVSTRGLIPVDSAGNPGGLTLANWSFLATPEIWKVTLNTFVLATTLTLGVLIVSSMAGYALARINFKGRKTFLGSTMVLQAFPCTTLLIATYFVLRFISGVPLLSVFGYDTLGGVILVSIATQLPLGIWLMKGFFDAIPWDLERAALIDGCSRWRTFRQILLPQIRPGIAALSVFSFIIGWSSYLIPYSFMTNQDTAVISTYLYRLMQDTAPVNYSMVSAVGLFQLLPVIFFFIFTQKYLLAIFAGGMKGGS